MAYSPSEKYPGAVDVDPDYQGGKFRDNNPSTTNNGSPLKAIDRNELLARDEAIMNDAGFEYNGLPDTPQDSQLFKAYKASLGNGANLLSNHNFLIQTPDDSQPPPDATPRSYPPGYQIFSGVFANESTGITNLTYIDGRVSFSGGDLYFAVPNSGGIERLTSDQLTASVADFDGKPRTRGVSFALVGDEYRVTIGIDALEDVSAVLTPLGSVKFEQGSVATGHDVQAVSARNLSDYTDIVYKASGGNSPVENMISDFTANPLTRAVGTIIKTGGTTWVYEGSTGPVTKDNFRAFDVLNAIDFEKNGSSDFSEAIQAAIDHLGGRSGKIVITDRVECKSQINVKSGASIQVTGMIIVDTDFVGDVLFDCATVRHNTKLDIKVSSAAMEDVDKISYDGNISTTPNLRVVRGGDCRQLKISGDITGILNRPIETTTGFEYDIHDMNIWGPNLTDADTIDTGEANNLESTRYTCGIFAPSTEDSKMSNVVVVGYNIGACIGSTWVLTDFHPWALKSSMIYGLAVFGQHNRGHGIYPDSVSKADGRPGVGIYEVIQSDRDTTTTVNNNYYGAVQVIGTYNQPLGDVWGVQFGDDNDNFAGTRSKVEFVNAAFTTDFPISYPNENIKMVNLIGQARKVNWRTPRYTGIEQPNNFVNEGAIPTQTTLPNLLVWAVQSLTGCYGNAKIVSNQNGWINTLLDGLNATAFDSSHNHTLNITTSKNEITDQVYVQVEISSVRKTDIVAKYQYYIQMATWTILYQDNEFYQGVVLGNTASRPTLYFNGFQYYDTDLNKPIWILGGTWRDATGTPV